MGRFIARKICLMETTTNNAYIKRCAYNYMNRVKISSPLTTGKIGATEISWLKYTQEGHDLTSETELRKENMRMWRCGGRIEGYGPIFSSGKILWQQRALNISKSLLCLGGRINLGTDQRKVLHSPITQLGEDCTITSAANAKFNEPKCIFERAYQLYRHLGRSYLDRFIQLELILAYLSTVK